MNKDEKGTLSSLRYNMFQGELSKTVIVDMLSTKQCFGFSFQKYRKGTG